MPRDIRELKDDPAAYADFFRRLLNGLLHVSLAAGAVCFAVPDLVVHTFFGARWMESVPVLHWLGLGLAAQPLLFAQGWLLESTGQVRRLLRLSLLGMGLVFGACALAAPRGIEAIALAGAAACLFQGLLGLALCRGCTPVTAADMTRAGLWPVISHGGFYNHLMGALTDQQPPYRLSYLMNNTGITRVALTPEGHYVVYQNRCDHLEDGMVTY